jgi:hypothetical protein
LGNSAPEAYRSDFGSLAGVTLDAGIVSRWFATYINLSYAKGSFQRETNSTNFMLPGSANASWDQYSIRFGPRFPFNLLSVSIQASLGGQELDLDQVRTGKPDFLAGVYGEVDIQPTCDWGAFILGGAQVASQENAKAFGLLQFGAFWEPNYQCRVEQSTPIGLSTDRHHLETEKGSPPAPPRP